MLCELAAGCGLNFYLLDANFVNTVSFCGKKDGKSSVHFPKKNKDTSVGCYVQR